MSDSPFGVIKPRLAAALKPSGAPRRKRTRRRGRIERQVKETTRRIDLKTILRHACAVGRAVLIFFLRVTPGAVSLPIWDRFLIKLCMHLNKR